WGCGGMEWGFETGKIELQSRLGVTIRVNIGYKKELGASGDSRVKGKGGVDGVGVGNSGVTGFVGFEAIFGSCEIVDEDGFWNIFGGCGWVCDGGGGGGGGGGAWRRCVMRVSNFVFRAVIWSCKLVGSSSFDVSLRGGMGDPLAPYLFILIMESLHLSIRRLVDNDLFKGIQLPGSVIISHLFYADDAMFIGLHIKICKSQLLGVGVPYHVVQQASSSIGCSITQNQFRYLGVTVGDRMTRIKAWENIIVKLRSWLSKWKTMEAIRSRFFNGIGQEDAKITWIAWNKVLASKKRGGLGVSSFFALNRALLLKWVWRFISQDGSLWSRVIRALYGPKSFRREPRGDIELQQLSDLVSLLDSAMLNNFKDRWYCDYHVMENFGLRICGTSLMIFTFLLILKQ
nr:RNA-directed DNA polymerase, eukaryota [Tanacetum cinerariifolium]